MVKHHVDQLYQMVDSSPESTSQSINDYYYSYEPGTPAPQLDINLVPPIPRQVDEEPHYPQRQYHPPGRYIHQY